MLQRVEALICRYSPAFVVLEDMEHTQRRVRAARRIGAIAKYGVARKIRVQLVSRGAVRLLFSATGSTKYDIAVAIAKVYPELQPRVPRRRKPWMSEDERMNIFDAMSFALTAFRSLENQQQQWSEAA